MVNEYKNISFPFFGYVSRNVIAGSYRNSSAFWGIGKAFSKVTTINLHFHQWSMKPLISPYLH
jgi:hypothetical protein